MIRAAQKFKIGGDLEVDRLRYPASGRYGSTGWLASFPARSEARRVPRHYLPDFNRLTELKTGAALSCFHRLPKVVGLNHKKPAIGSLDSAKGPSVTAFLFARILPA